MILLYSEKITPPIEYIGQLIFTQILNIEVSFSTNSTEFKNSNLPKFNYSSKKFADEFYIKPNKFIHDKNLSAPTINKVWYEGENYFFESSKDSVFPFDPLAASFYLVTRHEEYVEKERDELGRYPVEKSILSEYKLLKKPVVNIWAQLIAKKLHKQYPELIFPERKFKFISTIDIDNAWAFKNKGFIRTTGAIIKSIIKGNFSELKLHVNVLNGKEKDPYDSYEYLNSVFKGNEDKVKFFFLLGNYGRFDKNISHKNISYRKLIKKIKDNFDIGIHPSFASGQKDGEFKVKTEKDRLEEITGIEITKNRQHFVQLQFPNTYRRLINLGITEDYTMGHAAQPGFRAGICTPYYFYDLKKEKTTKLLIFPFHIMDGTLRHYLQLTPENALREIKNIMLEVKKVGGTFVSIWHNETVNDKDCWKGYRKVFEKMNQMGFEWSNR